MSENVVLKSPNIIALCLFFINDVVHTFDIIAVKTDNFFISIYQNLQFPHSSPFLLVEIFFPLLTCANNLFFLPWWERQ